MAAVKITRGDGWSNLLTGAGIQNRDKTQSTSFASSIFLAEQQLIDLYRDDGFAKRIVNLPADEMLRAGFEISEDDDDMVKARLQELKAVVHLQKALRWARLFGMGCIVMGIDDGHLMEDPVDEKSIRNIIFLRTFDRYRVTYTSADISNDSTNPNFGEVEVYNISPIQGMPFRCHTSRILFFEGEDMPDLARVSNDGWADSVIQSTYTQLRALGGMYGGIENIVEEFVNGVLTINNLQELIASGQEAVVLKRLQLIDLSRHIINTTLLDERETYEKHSTTVTGLPDVLDRFVQALSAVTGIPTTLLMGQSPAGLNATGASDVRMWYDKVHVEQEQKLLPNLETLVKYIFLSKEYYFRGVEPENWNITFNPLWEETAKEKADTRKTVADADHIYITDGVVTPEEVAQSRFGGEEWSMETELEFDRNIEGYDGKATPPEPEPVVVTAPPVTAKKQQALKVKE